MRYIRAIRTNTKRIVYTRKTEWCVYETRTCILLLNGLSCLCMVVSLFVRLWFLGRTVISRHDVSPNDDATYDAMCVNEWLGASWMASLRFASLRSAPLRFASRGTPRASGRQTSKPMGTHRLPNICFFGVL